MIQLGYCCINQTLNSGKSPVYTGRKLIRRTFSIGRASELALQNAIDLLTILKWNEAHNIKVFRIGSEMMPRSSDMTCGYAITQLPHSKHILDALRIAGEYAAQHNHLLSFHPGAFCCLGSPSVDVQQLSIYALERENEVADALCANANLDIPINFHIGGSYGGEFQATADRFLAAFDKLSPSLKSRVVIENDDKASCWSAARLCNMISSRSNIPVTFDLHHYLFCNEQTSGMTIRDEFALAYATWQGRNMQVHYSESADPNKLIPAHSDYYNNPLPDWVNEFKNIHCHLECKSKELALLAYRAKFKELNG